MGIEEVLTVPRRPWQYHFKRSVVDITITNGWLQNSDGYEFSGRTAAQVRESVTFVCIYWQIQPITAT